MKALVKILLVVALLIGTAATATARGRGAGKATAESRQQLALRQANRIASQLALKDDVEKRFVDTYVKCQQEIWKQKTDGRRSNAKLSEQQTDSMLRARMDRSRKLLDIREKYYKEYRKFLTAKQVARVYDLEGQWGTELCGTHHARKSSQATEKRRQERKAAVEKRRQERKAAVEKRREARKAAPAKPAKPEAEK